MELSEAPVMEPVKRGFKKTEVGMVPRGLGRCSPWLSSACARSAMAVVIGMKEY